jgi:hypothetical protein
MSEIQHDRAVLVGPMDLHCIRQLLGGGLGGHLVKNPIQLLDGPFASPKQRRTRSLVPTCWPACRIKPTFSATRGRR